MSNPTRRDDIVEWWRERSAIRQFDGDEDAETAERKAIDDTAKFFGLSPEPVRQLTQGRPVKVRSV